MTLLYNDISFKVFLPEVDDIPKQESEVKFHEFTKIRKGKLIECTRIKKQTKKQTISDCRQELQNIWYTNHTKRDSVFWTTEDEKWQNEQLKKQGYFNREGTIVEKKGKRHDHYWKDIERLTLQEEFLYQESFGATP